MLKRVVIERYNTLQASNETYKSVRTIKVILSYAVIMSKYTEVVSYARQHVDTHGNDYAEEQVHFCHTCVVPLVPCTRWILCCIQICLLH